MNELSFLTVEDFDFDFIDSTIKSSSDEMTGSLQTCLEELESMTREAELISGAQDFANGVSI